MQKTFRIIILICAIFLFMSNIAVLSAFAEDEGGRNLAGEGVKVVGDSNTARYGNAVNTLAVPIGESPEAVSQLEAFVDDTKDASSESDNSLNNVPVDATGEGRPRSENFPGKAMATAVAGLTAAGVASRRRNKDNNNAASIDNNADNNADINADNNVDDNAIPQGSGIWIPEKDRNTIIPVINENAKKTYNVDDAGFLEEDTQQMSKDVGSQTFTSLIDKLKDSQHKTVIGMDNKVSKIDDNGNVYEKSLPSKGITVGGNDTDQAIILNPDKLGKSPSKEASAVLGHEMAHAVDGIGGKKKNAVSNEESAKATENEVRSNIGNPTTGRLSTSDDDEVYSSYGDLSFDERANKLSNDVYDLAKKAGVEPSSIADPFYQIANTVGYKEHEKIAFNSKDLADDYMGGVNEGFAPIMGFLDKGNNWDTILGIYKKNYPNEYSKIEPALNDIRNRSKKFTKWGDLIYDHVPVKVEPPKAVVKAGVVGEKPPDIPAKGVLDAPAKDATVKGNINIGGWYAAPSGVKKVEVYVDGALKGTATTGNERANVYKAFPQYGIKNGGFHLDNFDTKTLSDGKHTIEIRGTGMNGETTTVDTRTVTVANGAGSNISYAPGVDSSVVSNHSIDVIKQVLADAGLKSAIITSTIRPPEKQAVAMYDNCESSGVQSQKELYGLAPGSQVIDVYSQGKAQGKSRNDIINDMTKKINDLWPQRVSLHCVPLKEYEKINVIDVGMSSVADANKFIDQLVVARNKGIINKFLVEQNNGCYHIEITVS